MCLYFSSSMTKSCLYYSAQQTVDKITTAKVTKYTGQIPTLNHFPRHSLLRQAPAAPTQVHSPTDRSTWMRMAPGRCLAVILAFGYTGPQCYTVRATRGTAQSLYAKVSMENSQLLQKYYFFRKYLSCFVVFSHCNIRSLISLLYLSWICSCRWLLI